MSPKFKLGCAGGTFDHLHAGHKAFLKKGFQFNQKIIIGLTSEKFTQDKPLAEAVLSFKKRERELEKFLKRKNFLKRVRIVKIDSPFPSAIFNPQVESLLITEKTRENSQILNSKRIKKGLLPLELIQVPIVLDQEGNCLSSKRIRLGQIDRKGRSWAKRNLFKKIHLLPRQLRSGLRKPMGRLHLGSEKDLKKAAGKLKKVLKNSSPTFLIGVGDIVTLSLLKKGVIPHLSLIDFKVRRKKVYQDISEFGFSADTEVKSAVNQAGTLNPELFLAIKEAIEDRFRIKSGMTRNSELVIKVLGEEDLAVLPAILLAPLGSLVCYGQPKQGIVAILVTEKKKQEIRELVDKFHQKDEE